MSRIRFTFGVWFIWLMSCPASFSQTNDQRVADAIVEIALLKRVVVEQDRRITELEKAVSALQLGTATKLQRPIAGDPPVASAQPNLATPWKTPAAWSRVKNGMSGAQAVAILGQPTSIGATGAPPDPVPGATYLTLFYRGEVAGTGSVIGTVKLMNDRVWQVNIPVF